MYLLALDTLSAEMHVARELINLALTSCKDFLGLAPSNVTGRRAAYILRVRDCHHREYGASTAKNLYGNVHTQVS